MKNLITRFKQGLYLRKEYVKVKGLPFSFAHISDLHVDGNGKLPLWIRKSIINSCYNTSILCVTGDLIDGTSENQVQDVLDFLVLIPVDYVVISFGNHDELYIDHFFDVISQDPQRYIKLKALVNNNFHYNGINFICLADKYSKYYSYGITCIGHIIDDDFFNVLLAHNPTSFKDVLNYHIPLVISGHTHGGQIIWADPLREIFSQFITNGNLLNILRINHQHDCFKLQGSYHECQSLLHINNGLASHSPGRFLCPPTLTVYES